MSRKERDRLKVVSALAECRLKQVAAGRLLGLSVRQLRRLLRRYREEGDVGLVHRARGRASNRRLPEATRRRAVALVRRQYRDFGPTLASEKISERDGITVSRQWLRGRLIEARRGGCGTVGSATTPGASGGRVSGNWCRWTRASTPGWRVAPRPSRCSSR